MPNVSTVFRATAALVAVAGATAAAQGTAGNCNAPTPEPVVQLSLPGSPFTPVVTPDGCWVFVALGGAARSGAKQGVAVVHRTGGRLMLVRTVPLKANGTGSALTHAGKMLIVATATSVAFLDVARLEHGTGDPLIGYLDVGDDVGAIYVSTTRSDDLLFVALERAQSVLVVDLAKVRRGTLDKSVELGRVPTGTSPIAVTLSNDERYLYTTSQAARPSWGWPIECPPEAHPTAASVTANGGVVVIDVARARTDAANAVVARVPVGCHTVRLVLSPDGNTAWVSVRGEHSIAALDTRKFLTDPEHAVLTRLRVGTAPVGVAVFDGGRKVIATNSNRFAGGTDDRQSLSVLDASAGPSSAKLIGTIPAGAFPRELRVTADGNTLLATNFGSRTLQVVDLRRLAAAISR